VTLPVALAVVVFAVTHRGEATITLWPTDIALHIPFFVVVLGSFLAGFLVGAVIMWLSGAKRWSRRRRQRYRAKELERELKRRSEADMAQARGALPPETGNGKSRYRSADLRP
jgi:uncharacterized integral membrane protein